MDSRVKLGVKAKDKITGWEGIVVSQLICLFGCNQWGITGQTMDKEGKRPNTEYFDEGRIEWTGVGITAEEVAGQKPGADYNSDAPR